MNAKNSGVVGLRLDNETLITFQTLLKVYKREGKFTQDKVIQRVNELLVTYGMKQENPFKPQVKLTKFID
ncbi:MAG: hypothetical protein COA90_07910 [Gammaproteobacteria bacterium]|nr:MAG: hypothetical protein COA90_07910 [Gammaproteobacteria bacterium]